jgi:hypothetical protein
MPDKAELKRRRAQSQRDKARNRREEEEVEREEEEARRRRAQSQRDKARNRREDEERITRIARAIQQQPALNYQPSQSAAVPVAQSSTISLVAIMEARSVKFMRDVARYLPFRLAQLYLIFTGCLMTRNTPMPRSLSTVKNYLFTNPLSARKANTSRRHSRTRSLREVQEYSHSIHSHALAASALHTPLNCHPTPTPGSLSAGLSSTALALPSTTSRSLPTKTAGLVSFKH